MNHPTMAANTILLLCLLSGISDVWSRCPRECSCKVNYGRKIVLCESGGMSKIRTSEMDADIRSLTITSPAEKHNNLSIGRIFLHMYQLEELRIVRSNVPAIGDSSFWPGRALHYLDLSSNNISFLHDSNFNGLKKLLRLDLSDNQIAATPSAPFRYLSSLKSLTLARNRLQSLVPRFFYMLPNLEELDISGNPLGEIDPENLQDVKGLRTLRLAGCNLTHLHSVLYQQLPRLQELDLRDNSIYVLAPEEFRHLKSLSVLRLDGNKLTFIEEVTFQNHHFDHLGLSRNVMVGLSSCAFCNASIRSLDLSHNHLTSFNSALKPIANSIAVLNISSNRFSGSVISVAIRPLKELRSLVASENDLSFLSHDMFVNNRHLRTLNLSHNQLDSITSLLLQPLMTSLEELDISFNHFPSLGVSILEQLEILPHVSMHGNRWSCTECEILPMLTWAHNSSLYNATCRTTECLRCDYPADLLRRELHTVSLDELKPCVEPVPQSRVHIMSSQMGIIIGACVAVFLLFLAILLISFYRRQGAVYYTHENESTYNGLYENLMAAGGANGCDEKPVFYTTLDRIDEANEEKSRFKRH